MTSDTSDRRSVIKSSRGLQLGIDDEDDRRGRSPAQNIGDVSISDSAEIHIGHNITYKAPVNITQHVYTAGNERSGAASSWWKARRDFFSLSKLSIGHWSRRKKAWSIGLAALSTIVVVAVVVVNCVGSLAAAGTSKLPPWNNDSSTNNNDSAALLFVQRSQWYAEPVGSPPKPLAVLPAILAIIGHTAGSPCHDLETCAKTVLSIQQHHKYRNGWSDIGYNFLVGGDGLVYVGRGWGVEGAHTYLYNNRSLGVALVGKFDEIEPAEAQLLAARRLLERAVERGHLARDYALLGQRQCKRTESPGNVAYGIIKGWPHWSLLPPPTTTTI